MLAETEYKYAYQKFNNWRQFCDQLPIYSKKVEFLDAFENNQVIILQSTAGSGKSTQLPQYILEACEGRTVITEPRAIAVESVANRVHAELTSCLAPEGIIGYICGPNFNIKAISKVVYMTEHEFLNQFLRDQQAFLDCFDNFVIDEAHELRKPQLVILAVLRNLLKENPKKKLIVTSATLEAELFKNYFSDFATEIITAETPTYGVEVIDNQFPDLETSIADNTIAHLKVILDVTEI
jgi:HrpA-like RNA helicase